MFLEKMIRSLGSRKYALDDDIDMQKKDFEEMSDIGIDTSFIDTGCKLFHTSLDLPGEIAVSVKIIKEFATGPVTGSAFLDNKLLWSHEFYSKKCKAYDKNEQLLERYGTVKKITFLFNGISNNEVDESNSEINSNKSLQNYFRKSLPNIGDTIGVKEFGTFDEEVSINFTKDNLGKVRLVESPSITTLLIPYGGFYDLTRKNFEVKQVYAIFKASTNEKKQIAFVTDDDIKQNTKGRIDLINGPLSCDGHVIEVFKIREKEPLMSLGDFIRASKLKLPIKNDYSHEYVSQDFLQEKSSSDFLTIVFRKNNFKEEEKCQNYQQHTLYRK